MLVFTLSLGATPAYWGIYSQIVDDGIFNVSIVSIYNSGEVVEVDQIFSNSTSDAAYLVAERDSEEITVALWTMHYNSQFIRFDFTTRNSTVLPFGDLQGQVYGMTWWEDRKSSKKGLLVLACGLEKWHLWYVAADAKTPPEILVSLHPFDDGYAWCDPGGASFSLLPETNEAYVFLTLTAFLIVNLDTKRIRIGPNMGRFKFSCTQSIKAIAAFGNGSNVAYVGEYAFRTSVGTIDVTRSENHCSDHWQADSTTDIVCVDPLYPWILSDSMNLVMLCQPILAIYYFDEDMKLSKIPLTPKTQYLNGNWGGVDFYSKPAEWFNSRNDHQVY